MTWLNWKKWPYWLRGGVIGGVIGILPLVAILFCSFGFGCVSLFLAPLFPIRVLIGFSDPIFHYNWTFTEGYAPIINIILWFFTGSLVGALVGYIKSRKKNSVQQK